MGAQRWVQSMVYRYIRSVGGGGEPAHEMDCVWELRGRQQRLGEREVLWNWVKLQVDVSYGYFLNPGTLQEQQILLTAGLSL